MTRTKRALGPAASCFVVVVMVVVAVVVMVEWGEQRREREKKVKERGKTLSFHTFSAAMVTPAAIDTSTCLSARTGRISAITVETYCGLTAMKTMSEDWTTCFSFFEKKEEEGVEVF